MTDFVVEQVGAISVVRDDLLTGGTKVRALPVLFTDAREYVYAGPAEGYAQIALAVSCAAYGKRAVVFVARRQRRHPFTQRAAAHGARIVEVAPGYLSVVRARARAYAELHHAVLLPFGFDCPAFREALAQAVLAGLAPRLTPSEVWSVAGSGTLTRALQKVWPEVPFHAVRIGAEPRVGRATVHQAPEPFARPAALPPPFPSCASYDAKAWRFVSRAARPGALFWNVGA